MFFLWFEIAILILAMGAVAACCVQLILDDEDLLNWFRTHKAEFITWAKFYIVRYKHTGRHTPRAVMTIPERREEWKQSLAFSAT